MKGERVAKPSEEKMLEKRRQAAIDTANWSDIADDVPDAPDLAEEYRDLKDTIKLAEDRCRDIAPSLEAAVIIGGKKGLACGNGYKVIRASHPGSPQFKPEALVEKLAAFGLTADQILEATVCCITRKPYTYVVVTREGEPDEPV